MSTNAYRQACTRCDELRQQLEALKQQQSHRSRLSRALSALFERVLTPTVVFGSVIVVTVFASAPAIVRALSTPSALPPCQDSAEIVRASDARRSCHEQAAVSTEIIVPGQVLVRCTCLRPGGGP